MSDATDHPFWREAAPLETPGAGPLPDAADVLVIGAGFTGLSCARALARAGRSVLVVDAKAPGFGASARNGGMIGWGHRADLATLSRAHGAAAALEILREGPRALAFTLGLIEEEGIACDFRRTGRYLAAASAKHFDALRREAETAYLPMGVPCRVIDRAAQPAEIVTDAYVGGVLFEDHGGLHPGKLHGGLLDAARRAGAQVEGNAPVEALNREGGGWRVETPRGAVRAAEVAFAANGYVGRFSTALRGFARRLIPLPSYIIATEPLGAERIRALMPGGRMVVDTRSAHSYFRASPDGARILWGGRASLLDLPQAEATLRLRRHMASIFPELAEARIDYSWTGRIAYTRDSIPHVGRLGGVWFACGYCGSGVAMAPYLGWRMAQKILGAPEAACALDVAALRRVPPYRGEPWFMRAVELWHRWKDRRDGVLAPVDR